MSMREFASQLWYPGTKYLSDHYFCFCMMVSLYAHMCSHLSFSKNTSGIDEEPTLLPISSQLHHIYCHPISKCDFRLGYQGCAFNYDFWEDECLPDSDLIESPAHQADFISGPFYLLVLLSGISKKYDSSFLSIQNIYML